MNTIFSIGQTVMSSSRRTLDCLSIAIRHLSIGPRALTPYAWVMASSTARPFAQNLLGGLTVKFKS